jgi:hypothetical protein
MLQCGGSSFFARNGVIGTLRTVREILSFSSSWLVWLLMIRITLFNQSRQVRHAVWFPLHEMEFSLPPILPHGSSVIPPSLSPCIVFRDPATLRRVRLFDSTLRPRWRLQIAALLIINAVWNFSIFSPLVYVYGEHMDQRGMSRCSMVEDLGLQPVRDRQSDCFHF